MNNRTMTMQVVGEPTQKPGDIVHINEERWIIVRTVDNWTYTTIYYEPLSDYLARTKKITINGQEMTIADYLKILCDEYENDCSC